jgi:hypothetical protein
MRENYRITNVPKILKINPVAQSAMKRNHTGCESEYSSKKIHTKKYSE